MYASYEDAAIAAKNLWDTGDTEGAQRAWLEARAFVADRANVYQQDDGTLQIVPFA